MEAAKPENETRKIFSGSVGDTFLVSVSLPVDYSEDTKHAYPVVYVLDANVYFDVFKSIVNKYSQVGLVPEVILVGIGYKNLQALDSLRERDYTFPVAEARHEMKLSGKADKYFDFLSRELIPRIEKQYRTEKTRRTLFGHSLGGFFVTYAFLQSLETGAGAFQNYIAASPSLDYNSYYILKSIDSIKQKGLLNSESKLFTSYGQLENEENSDEKNEEKVELTLEKLERMLGQNRFNNLKHKSVVFSNLAHMETAIPTFVQGLNWTLNNNTQQ